MAAFNVNLFEHDPPLEISDIAQRMKDALAPFPQISLGKERSRNKNNIKVFSQAPRRCMQDYETAIVSGRHCDKLIAYLHFHKGGGTSMIEYFHLRDLKFYISINSDPPRFDDFQAGEDMKLSGWKDNLRLTNNW
eukprot:7648569-Ditylum_brightwellii.AAC.1